MKLADAYTLLISIFICKKSCYYFSIDSFYWLIQISGTFKANPIFKDLQIIISFEFNNLNTY